MTTNHKGVLIEALEALKEARDELYSCHSHCDPETSNDSQAVAYRNCRDTANRLQALIDDVENGSFLPAAALINWPYADHYNVTCAALDQLGDYKKLCQDALSEAVKGE